MARSSNEMSMEVHVSDDVTLWSATRLEAAIRSRELSSRELLTAYQRRVAALDPRINAIVTLDYPRAQEAAARADEAATRGQWLGPLHGLPFTVKDAIETAGLRSTGGAPELASHVPTTDAPAVSRLSSAGGILFGKTNAPRWSADIQTHNDLFGVTRNPWDLDRTTGGSSGGAAAAVASGMTGFELGTDIGGSIRLPSSFCGVYGHKPSYGIISQRGYLDHAGGGTTDADVNVFGPIARSVEDLELLFGVLAAPDAEDAAAWRLDVPPARAGSLVDVRIGTWLDDPSAAVESEVGDVLQDAVDRLARSGAAITPDRPDLDLAAVERLYLGLVGAAASISMDPAMLKEVGLGHRQWLELNEQRARVRQTWHRWFAGHDVLLCPVVPTAAFPHDAEGTVMDRTVEIDGKPRSHFSLSTWTGMIGVAYLPSTVIPVGRTRSGLPVGMQVVGPYLEDRTSLWLARQFAGVLGDWEPPPMAR